MEGLRQITKRIMRGDGDTALGRQGSKTGGEGRRRAGQLLLVAGCIGLIIRGIGRIGLAQPLGNIVDIDQYIGRIVPGMRVGDTVAMAVVRGQIKALEYVLYTMEESHTDDTVQYADTVIVDEPDDLSCFGVGETPLERAVNPDNIMRPPPIIEGMQCEGAAPACESCPPRMRVTPIKRQCRIIRFPLEV